MAKIDDLPYLDAGSIYYDDRHLVLAGNGTSVDGDYVTGQISADSMLETYIAQRVANYYESPDIDYATTFLYKPAQDSEHIVGIGITDFTSNICSYIVEGDYLSDYLGSFVYDYIANQGYLNDYLSEYFDSKIGEIGSVSYTDTISGTVVLSEDGHLEYVPTSSVADLIYYTIYYEGQYPSSLSDDTPIAGMEVYGRLASISLGSIVSYIREHL